METKLTDSKSTTCTPQGDEHKISLPEFLQRLGVDESGLSEQEATRRLQEYGPVRRAKLYHGLRYNPPFYPFRMSLLWCASLATDLCKAQRTTRCKTEPDSSKPLGKWTYGEPKGEDPSGSSVGTCESRLNNAWAKMAPKPGYNNLYRVITNGHMGFRSYRILLSVQQLSLV